jgi:ADP-heptose:LPS heptosyltransferase
MRFLVARQPVKANIFGHDYALRSITSPEADLEDLLVADEGSGRELLHRFRGLLAEATFKERDVSGFPRRLEDPGLASPGSRMLILKSGGVGDHIMLLPALRALERRLRGKSLEIRLAVQKDMFPIFQGCSCIDRLYPLPLTFQAFREADCYLPDFEGTAQAEGSPVLHLTDAYLQWLRLDPQPPSDKTPSLSPPLARSGPVRKLFSRLREDHPRNLLVLLNWVASTAIKSLPPGLFRALVRARENMTFLVAHPSSLQEKTLKEINAQGLEVLNITEHMKGLEEYFTAISLADAVVCPDTSTYHVAAAYGKPSLVILGPTCAMLTKYYPHCRHLKSEYRGSTCASPCGRSKGVCPEAQDQGAPYSPCLASISPADLRDAFHDLVRDRIASPDR